MTLIADLVRALAATGATAEQIAAAVEVIERQQIEKEEARKAKGRERVRKHRERNANNGDVTSRNVTNVTPHSPLSLSPTPPNPNPPLSPISEANASGAGAPNVVPFDPRADLFGRGIQAVIAMTGKSRPQAATMVGHWLKIVADEAVTVLRVIDEAADHRPANPVAWIEAALRKRGSSFPRSGPIRAKEGFI